MTSGVFVHRADSIYDDSPAERYQFPKQYLSRAESCVNDWVVYYEPRKVPETRGYFAAAKVERVVADTASLGMYFALMTPGTYIDFANPVPFTDAGVTVERGILNEHGRISGRAQAAVRHLSAADFNMIVGRGLRDTHTHEPQPAMPLATAFEEEQEVFGFENARHRVEQLLSRAIRDRVFRAVVLGAYDQRCAVSSLKLINGGGRAEAVAAHIKPVSADGPDVVTNGIALCGTAHWMFDRGLIALSDDLQILISRQANDPDSIRAFINQSGFASTPTRALARPHPRFLQWHRENCFKQ